MAEVVFVVADDFEDVELEVAMSRPMVVTVPERGLLVDRAAVVDENPGFR